MGSKSFSRSMPTFRAFLGGNRAQSESGGYDRPLCSRIPGAPSPVPSSAALSGTGTPTGMLTFRDLLPASTDKSSRTVAHLSQIPMPPSWEGSVASSDKASSEPYDSPNTPESSKALELLSASAHCPLPAARCNSPHSASALFDPAEESDSGSDPASPCMSCPSAARPTSVARYDASVDVSGSLSPPAMTPPRAVGGSEGVAADARTRPQTLGVLLQHAGGMQPKSRPGGSPLLSHVHGSKNACTQDDSTFSDDKENTVSNSQTFGKLGSACAAFEHLACQPLGSSSNWKHCGLTNPSTRDSQQKAQDPASWRQMHFGQATNGEFITDDLILAEMSASKLVSPKLSSSPPPRKKAFRGNLLDPSELLWLQNQVRPASAPPGPDGSNVTGFGCGSGGARARQTVGGGQTLRPSSTTFEPYGQMCAFSW